MKIENIVFLQGDAANEAMTILDESGTLALYRYLMQWYFPNEHEILTVDSIHDIKGTSDRYKEYEEFYLTWNTSLGYCGLLKKLNNEV